MEPNYLLAGAQQWINMGVLGVNWWRAQESTKKQSYFNIIVAHIFLGNGTSVLKIVVLHIDCALSYYWNQASLSKCRSLRSVEIFPALEVSRRTLSLPNMWYCWQHKTQLPQAAFTARRSRKAHWVERSIAGTHMEVFGWIFPAKQSHEDGNTAWINLGRTDKKTRSDLWGQSATFTAAMESFLSLCDFLP